jgi:phage protein D
MSLPGVAGAIVRISGRETDEAVADKLVDAIVDCQLRLPDRLTLRYRDFDLQLIDSKTFSIGAEVEVALGSAEANGIVTVFDGLITSLEPEFGDQGAILVVGALDRSQLLQRAPQTATYQQMSYGEIAAELAEKAGLEAGEISPGLMLPFVQQSNETDWDFLWRLALEVDCQVRVTGRTLAFSPASTLQASVTRLAWGEGLLAFAPRVSGVQQMEEVTVRGWDPATASTFEASAPAPTPESRVGVSRETVVKALGGAAASVVDRPVMSEDHAAAVAKSLAAQMSSVFIEGCGTAQGTPSLAAGTQVHIEGVGETFSGIYALTGVKHRFRAQAGYRTDFAICGRARRTLLGLAHPPSRPGWRRRVAVGVVSNTTDPEKLGRVRVRYPSLGKDHEGWWARVVGPGSGAGRGFFSLPQVEDEVLVVFEHEDDQHPYVVGSVFNGAAAPRAVVQPDGSFTLATPHHVTIDATQRAEITTKDKLTLTADAEVSLSAGTTGSLSAKEGVSLSAGTTGSLSANEGITISGGEQVKISADGSIAISGATISIAATETVTISGSEIILG